MVGLVCIVQVAAAQEPIAESRPRFDVSIGTWLVWWAINLQQQFLADEIKSACQRMMPETVQRCMDTVIIQRGVARR